MHTVTLDHIEKLTDQIWTFWWRPHQPFGYSAGQFISMQLPHATPDVRGEQRWFTLSSSPTEPLLAITTSFAGSSSSFKEALRKLVPGDEVRIAEALGDFVLPKNEHTPLLFVAAGLGITPVRSITAWLHDIRQQRNIRLIHAAHDESALLFRDLFQQQYKDQYMPVVKRQSANWRGKTGSLTIAHIRPHITSNTIVYLAGPESLTESLAHELHAYGHTGYQIVTDYFPGYAEV